MSQGVLLAFIHSTEEGCGFPTLTLKRLDANAEYALTAIEGNARGGSRGCEWGMVHEPWLGDG
jgi:hypothetical protein